MESSETIKNGEDEEGDILSRCLRLIYDDEVDAPLPPTGRLECPGQSLNSCSTNVPVQIRVPIVCDICNKEFHTQSNLKVHKREIHTAAAGRKGEYACGDCGQVYTRLRSLERHQNKAHLKNTPQCRICRKRVVNFELHYRKFHCKSVSVQVGSRKKATST